MTKILSILSLFGSILVTPFLVLLASIIFLASMGQSLGVRRLYVNMLLMIFEYGRKDIEYSQKNKINPNKLNKNGESYNIEMSKENKSVREFKYVTTPNGIKNGMNNDTSQVITRDNDLILVPEPTNKVSPHEKILNENKDNIDFELSTVIDYIKSGIESIIEDQVTSRFEAEELKNWNLLTRTHSGYEFISWKLTIIWIFGFIFRYLFMFPLRVTICFIGILILAFSMAILGILPPSSFKRWLSKKLYIICFRIISRSTSNVIRFHNKHLRPANGTICVANHTSPVDVAILSVDNCFCLVLWLTLCMALVGYVKHGDFKRLLNKYVSIMCFGILSRAISSVVTYHNEENKPKNGICVANHTSPIDVLILMCDNCYSLIGQRHGGFLGILQRALARASPHIWFERSEARDRHAVAKRLKEHVSDPKNPPILIFPEGTCINNTSVMQFKKGSFEVGSVIYPVAIKYDPRFGDAFWNSSRYSMLHYLYMMMTSWAIVCDVWYLPPMYQREQESAIDFANRVKSAIARQGGLVDLMWDGQLKRTKAKKEWKERQQEEFSKRLKVEQN